MGNLKTLIRLTLQKPETNFGPVGSLARKKFAFSLVFVSPVFSRSYEHDIPSSKF